MLDMFSGIPNPEWTVDLAVSAKIVALLAGLASAGSDAVPEPPALGYRGFEISGFEGACPTVRVYKGYIDACGKILADEGSSLEKMLAEQSKDYVPPPVFEMLKQQLGG